MITSTRRSNWTRAFDQLVEAFTLAANGLQVALDDLVVSSNEFLDHKFVEAEVDSIKAKIASSLALLASKQTEPSRSIVLPSLADGLDSLSVLIASANVKTADLNKTVADFGQQREALTKQVWKYIVDDELKAPLDQYASAKRKLSESIRALQTAIADTKAERDACKAAIEALEEQVTSVAPTLTAINRLLESQGFTSFSLAPTEDGKGYTLVREDGSPAKESLSEGERSFVAFLYFYHLLMGNRTESGGTADRIAVFDDPVSSMDSDVLFIVSTLIRRVCANIGLGEGNIKQAFVLTHNVYFHKEVTFRATGSKGTDGFWVIRKRESVSQVVPHGTKNPVKTSYQMLWDEIGEEKRSPASVQNAMRRILEHYFTVHGDLAVNDLPNLFDDDDPDRLVCRSLVSWAHAGSHTIEDDLFVSTDDSTIDNYCRVFKLIFTKSGHANHFDMMCPDKTKAELAALEEVLNSEVALAEGA